MAAPASLAFAMDSLICLALQSKSIAHWFRLDAATFNSLMVFFFGIGLEFVVVKTTAKALLFKLWCWELNSFDSTKLRWSLFAAVRFNIQNSLFPSRSLGRVLFLSFPLSCPTRVNFDAFISFQPSSENNYGIESGLRQKSYNLIIFIFLIYYLISLVSNFNFIWWDSILKQL